MFFLSQGSAYVAELAGLLAGCLLDGGPGPVKFRAAVEGNVHLSHGFQLVVCRFAPNDKGIQLLNQGVLVKVIDLFPNAPLLLGPSPY